MKKILFFVALLGFNKLASSQNVFPTGVGTNVGIGIVNPVVPLHVQGGGTTTGLANIGTSLTARFNTANPPITLGIGYVSSDNPFIQAFNSTNNVANHLIINPFGGNVGIGTITPTEQLEVSNPTTGAIRLSSQKSQLVANGLNLGEMNKILTKKVEELTLYLIEENRKNTEQKELLQMQEIRLQKLEKLVSGYSKE